MSEPWFCLQAEPAQPGNRFLSGRPVDGSRVSPSAKSCTSLACFAVSWQYFT
jgi:hypothetical protein